MSYRLRVYRDDAKKSTSPEASSQHHDNGTTVAIYSVEGLPSKRLLRSCTS
ncbi:hypothetical protein J6590_071643 [Homalodisca vitripennis]|nr:hypothetical protein J6590_087535 [Homalodisca vitripennis]KAG8300658.1 hypothetical protein J6590_071643 [Homalodisca vitripennis]